MTAPEKHAPKGIASNSCQDTIRYCKYWQVVAPWLGAMLSFKSTLESSMDLLQTVGLEYVDGSILDVFEVPVSDSSLHGEQCILTTQAHIHWFLGHQTGIITRLYGESCMLS